MTQVLYSCYRYVIRRIQGRDIGGSDILLGSTVMRILLKVFTGLALISIFKDILYRITLREVELATGGRERETPCTVQAQGLPASTQKLQFIPVTAFVVLKNCLRLLGGMSEKLPSYEGH